MFVNLYCTFGNIERLRNEGSCKAWNELYSRDSDVEISFDMNVYEIITIYNGMYIVNKIDILS